MDDKSKSKAPHNWQQDHINRLAKDAITTARSHLSSDTSLRLNEATEWLEAYSLKADFDTIYALQTLSGRGVAEDIIVDHCIPRAACSHGDRWVSDTLSFSEVSIGTAHLQMLLKTITGNRKVDVRNQLGKCLLITALEDEQHTLGALVLGDQMRRKGYSLKILINSTLNEISHLMSNNSYDALLFSAGSERIAQLSAQCVNKIRQIHKNSPKMFLGGSILAFGVSEPVSSEFNLVTNNLDLVIDEIENNVIRVSSRTALERYNS